MLACFCSKCCVYGPAAPAAACIGPEAILKEKSACEVWHFTLQSTKLGRKILMGTIQSQNMALPDTSWTARYSMVPLSASAGTKLHCLVTLERYPYPAVMLSCSIAPNTRITRMWANAQPDGRPAKHRWRPLFNTAKFGWRSPLDCRAVTLRRRESCWN